METDGSSDGGGKDWNAVGVSGSRGTEDEPPMVAGVDGSSKPPVLASSTSMGCRGEPGALRGTEGISGGPRGVDDVRDG